LAGSSKRHRSDECSADCARHGSFVATLMLRCAPCEPPVSLPIRSVQWPRLSARRAAEARSSLGYDSIIAPTGAQNSKLLLRGRAPLNKNPRPAAYAAATRLILESCSIFPSRRMSRQPNVRSSTSSNRSNGQRLRWDETQNDKQSATRIRSQANLDWTWIFSSSVGKSIRGFNLSTAAVGQSSFLMVPRLRTRVLRSNGC
jgi:hypothetical protein